jgi:hypothetical protein
MKKDEFMTTSRADPTIDELLDDPLTRAVMRADRVDPRELEAMLRALASLIARRAGRSAGDAVERVPLDPNAGGRFLRSMGRGRSKSSRGLAARPAMRAHPRGVSLPW